MYYINRMYVKVECLFLLLLPRQNKPTEPNDRVRSTTATNKNATNNFHLPARFLFFSEWNTEFARASVTLTWFLCNIGAAFCLLAKHNQVIDMPMKVFLETFHGHKFWWLPLSSCRPPRRCDLRPLQQRQHAFFFLSTNLSYWLDVDVFVFSLIFFFVALSLFVWCEFIFT